MKRGKNKKQKTLHIFLHRDIMGKKRGIKKPSERKGMGEEECKEGRVKRWKRWFYMVENR